MKNIVNTLKSLSSKSKIYLCLSAVAVLVFTAGLWANYFKIYDTIFQIEIKNATESLNRIQSSTMFVVDNRESLTESIYADANTQVLMFDFDSYGHEVVRSINNLKKQVGLVQSGIHSIYIYNAHNGNYYSTNNYIENRDPDFFEMEQAIRQSDVPMLRKVSGEYVVTFCKEDWNYSSSDELSALFVNYKVDNFLNEYDAVTNIDSEYDSLLLVADQNNGIINLQNTDESLTQFIKDIKNYNGDDKHVLSNTAFVLKDATYQGEQYTMTLVNVERLNWDIVRMYPNSILYQNIAEIRALFIVINITMILIVVGVFFKITKDIFKPIDSLAKTIKSENENLRNITNEFEILRKFHQYSNEQITRMSDESSLREGIVYDYYIKKLLYDTTVLTEKHDDEIKERANIKVDLNQDVRLLLIRIDDMSTLHSQSEQMSEEIVVLRAVASLVSELFSSELKIDCAVTTKNNIAVLYQGEDMSLQAEYRYIERLRNKLKNMFNLTATVCHLSNPVSPKTIVENYANLEEGRFNRFMLGNSADVLDPVGASSSVPTYKFNMEWNFIADISKSVEEDCINELKESLLKIRKLRYQEATLAITHLTLSFQEMILKINEQRDEPIKINEIILRLSDLNQMTIDRYENILIAFLRECFSVTQEKQNYIDVVGESIKQLIESVYSDKDLGAAMIGDELGISASYVGKVCREYTGMSIPEYVNKVRMDVAMDWLTNSNLTLAEVMDKVGYRHESTFYKAFRQQYGMSPRNYVKNKQTDKL